METTKFIPIYEYAKRHGVSKQNIYRWIRERKVPEDKVKKVKKEVERIFIDESWHYGTKNIKTE